MYSSGSLVSFPTDRVKGSSFSFHSSSSTRRTSDSSVAGSRVIEGFYGRLEWENNRVFLSESLLAQKLIDLPIESHDVPHKKSGLEESSWASFTTAVLIIFNLQRESSCQGFSAPIARQLWYTQSARWHDE